MTEQEYLDTSNLRTLRIISEILVWLETNDDIIKIRTAVRKEIARLEKVVIIDREEW